MDQSSIQELPSFLSNMPSQENKKVYQKWYKQDKILYAQLYKLYGTSFDKYQSYFPGRTKQQIQYFFGNQVNKIKRCSQKSLNITKMNQNCLFQKCEPEDLQETGCQKRGQIIIQSKDDNLMNQNENIYESFLFDEFFL
ncbi:Homeobox-like_domain superfamily [Hexamita inflata]|uniref:Homeobox-like domain superfamily n=1 Tax=Hexamita inflata TaxID=28002 RepID=A0AA86Q5J9_9EUKA|nr:Homeobox-like domain superfamily [Hexamita inflata]